MKQFNLEEYNRRVAEGETPEIVTRDGRKARIICTDRKDGVNNNKYTIIALVLLYEGHESFYSYNEEGELFYNEKKPADLFFAPCKKIIKGWVNVYKRGFSGIHESEESALRAKGSSCIKTIEISTEIEEE